MRPNPKKLNALQLKTLVLLQAMARDKAFADTPGEDGGVVIRSFPHAHGNHFHLGEAVVSSKDATGLGNPNVMNALSRRGLVIASSAGMLILTADGLSYDTGLNEQILHRSDH